MPTPSDPNRPATNVDPSALVRVGFVYRPHGVHGELKVDPRYTDDPARFDDLDVVYVGDAPERAVAHAVASVRYQQTKRGTTVILGLDDVTSREDADRVSKRDVFAHADDLPMDEDEVFVHDVVGMRVLDEEETLIGTVSGLLTTAAHDVLVVERNRGGEVLIPAVPDFVVDMDLDADELIVRPIDGLIDSDEALE